MARRHKQFQPDPDQILANQIEARTSNLFNKSHRTLGNPSYLVDNLKHHLRNYQWKALDNLNLTQHDPNADKKYNLLMFNMATGSGKTDIMAAIILYMYAEFGVQEFLYVIDSSDIVAKTCDNFINSRAAKYLFKAPLQVHGVKVKIRDVSKLGFPETENLDNNTIYIALTTIQGLYDDINNPKENSLTIDDFRYNPVVVLADEAHHFSADTKGKRVDKYSSWESTLDRIRDLNPKNRQFEFTATVNLHNRAIFNKYASRIVYQYLLSDFITSGYSKQAYCLLSNDCPKAKMFDAILLSQYRKRLASHLGDDGFKPVVLFKSNFIKPGKHHHYNSQQAQQDFKDLISSLTPALFTNLLKNRISNVKDSNALSFVYSYWLKQQAGPAVHELQHDFDPRTMLDANDKKDPAYVARSLNTLESPNNAFRAIFEVDKLNEGWDVLNLFDIVRLGGASRIKPHYTDGEAQLIGRGCRFYPLYYNNPERRKFYCLRHKYNADSYYQRKYDNRGLKYELLERLYYFTISNHKYTRNLKKSLDGIDLPVNNDQKGTLKHVSVMNWFKKTNAYRKGYVYYNRTTSAKPSNARSLKSYGVENPKPTVDMTTKVSERKRNDLSKGNSTGTYISVVYDRLSSDLRLLFKALASNPFYRFDNLKRYFKSLKSMHEFMTSTRYLGGIDLKAEVNESADKLSRSQQLTAVKKYLYHLQIQLSSTYGKRVGTNKFISEPVKALVHDYDKRVTSPMNTANNHAVIEDHELKHTKKSGFVYDKAVVNGLEWKCINQIGLIIRNDQYKGDHCYLIRNDETSQNAVKLHSFEGGVRRGYMPDFILYVSRPRKDHNFIYELYVEPKGTQIVSNNQTLAEIDRWKEQILNSIRPNKIEVLGSNGKNVRNVRLFGIKFFLPNDTEHAMKQVRHILKIQKSQQSQDLF